jgi:DNA primase
MRYLLLFEDFDTKKHLIDRGVDPDKTQLIIDEESGDTFFFLYNLSGQMVGYQKYNSRYDKKGQDAKKMEDPKKTKYYNWVGDEPEGKKIAVWGLETTNFTDKYLFITEGIFDIARAHQVGYPGIAVLCNDPSPQLAYWLKTLPQTKIVIYDNDAAGEKLRKLGDYSFSVKNSKDLNDLSEEEAKEFLDDIIKLIEN